MDASSVVNYFVQRNLKHDTKPGNFSFSTEDRIIIQLHALLGNKKWSTMSSQLPMEMNKNDWNTNIKNRLIRMGIDSTHKPKTNTFDACGGDQSNHIAQWESTQFEIKVSEFMLQVGSSFFVYPIH